LNFSSHTRIKKRMNIIGSRELGVLENDFIKALGEFLCQPIVVEIVLKFSDPTGIREVTELSPAMMYREDADLPARPMTWSDAKGQVELMVRKPDLKALSWVEILR